MPRPPTGITTRHGRACRSRDGGKCNCDPSYEAWVYDQRTRQKIRRTFRNQAEAKVWRIDASSGLRKGRFSAPTRQTLEEAATAWLEKAERGEVLSRNRRPYKPSSLRGYRHDLEAYVFDDLGALRLSEVRRRDLQELVERLIGDGLSGSKVRNVLVPLQAVYRHARSHDTVNVDPTDNLQLPAAGGRRERAASVDEAAQLIAALPEEDRALWATAFYAGLRRGELRGLRDEDVDLAANLIHVRRGWDDVEGEIAPKSEKGARKVPIPALLRRYLLEHRARTGRRGAELFFGRTAGAPFTPTHVRDRARGA